MAALNHVHEAGYIALNFLTRLSTSSVPELIGFISAVFIQLKSM